MINFLDISYLQLGNERQQRAYQVLTHNKVLEKLAPYRPILVGTVPINIDIETAIWILSAKFLIKMNLSTN